MLASPDSVADPSWYVDFGASNHIIADLDNLFIHGAYNGNDKVFVGNCMKLVISHFGSSILASLAKTAFIIQHVMCPSNCKEYSQCLPINKR